MYVSFCLLFPFSLFYYQNTSNLLFCQSFYYLSIPTKETFHWLSWVWINNNYFFKESDKISCHSLIFLIYLLSRFFSIMICQFTKLAVHTIYASQRLPRGIYHACSNYSIAKPSYIFLLNNRLLISILQSNKWAVFVVLTYI